MTDSFLGAIGVSVASVYHNYKAAEFGSPQVGPTYMFQVNFSRFPEGSWSHSSVTIKPAGRS